MKSTLFAAVTGAALLLCAGQAEAHAVLINPVPLTQDDNAKSGPCGCYFGAGPEDPTEDTTPTACPASGYKVTDLVPGQKVQVTWKETVNHTGKFRVAISSKNIDTATRADLDLGVLYEDADKNTVAGGIVSAMITIPDSPCQHCVLQMRQYMEVASTPYYYSCAAININAPSTTASSSSAATTGAGGSGGAGGEGGSLETGSIGPGPAPIEQTQASGACNVSREGEGAGWLGMVFLGLWFVATQRKQS